LTFALNDLPYLLASHVSADRLIVFTMIAFELNNERWWSVSMFALIMSYPQTTGDIC